MKVLVVGSGGREHALCWSIAASPLCDKLYCAPGNAGIAAEAECVPIGAEDVPALVDFAKSEAIDFVVVGPEAPLCAGLVDRLTEAGIKAFGPSAAAAQLEGSKGFMKDLCAKYDIPTAAYGRFSDAEAAKAYVREQGAPIVVKADGLAAGKGVTVAQTLDEALAAVDDALLDGRFGAAGAEVVVEAFLAGEEVSVFAICDGKTALVLASAQDHKAVYDGDKGPNTGGMGAYSPAPVMDDALAARVEAATALLADSAESAVLRLHPDDVALVKDRLPPTIFTTGDATLERGNFVLEGAATLVEDGPELWLAQLAAAIERVPLPLCAAQTPPPSC